MDILKRVRWRSAWLLMVLTLAWGCQEEATETEVLRSIEDVIVAAGNAASETERYQLLAGLLEREDVTGSFRSDLDQLLRAVDRWANGRERYWEPGEQELAGEGGYLGGFFVLKVWPFDDGYPHQVELDSPLYPIRALYRGRMLIWNALEMGLMQDLCYEDGRALLEVARQAFPDNPVIPIYLGEPMPWPALFQPAPSAPQWATLQREALGKLRDIIFFWIHERQAPDGQFGGGWGDDVEMWRQWTPILMGFDEPELTEAQGKLADGLFALERLEGGYTNILIDVEHSAEDTGDTITSMLHLSPNDTRWQERALRLAELMETLWTGINQRGYRQFKSTYFTSTQVDASGSFACDTPYHARAVQPLLLYWQRTSDPEVGQLLSSWLRGWLAASESEERGKPAGVIPAAVGYPSGEPAGPGSHWWNPGCHVTDDLFVYPRGLSGMLRALLVAYDMSRDTTFLEPIDTLAMLRRAYLEGTQTSEETGDAIWAASEVRGALRDALEKYRLITGMETYDDVLLSSVSTYAKYVLTGDEVSLLQGLENTVAALGFNEATFKDEVRFSDRVFAFRKYHNDFAEAPLQTYDADLLYGMVTGDFGDPLYLPLNGVKWLTSAQDIAVRVMAQSALQVTAEMYHFGTQERDMGASFFRLRPGFYRWSLTCAGQPEGSGAFQVSEDNHTVEFRLPAGQVCVFDVRSR
ncbi:MAG: hypothetical protein VX834_13785 [Myxococcota bacterium]|nr:hypothetical protein [Myxococcota bacterium]